MNWFKKWWFTIALCLLALAVCGGIVTANGGFNLDWYTWDGGGGASAGGDYLLEGTVGQPEGTNNASGGDYQLVGGYWPGAVRPDYALYLPVLTRP